MARFAKVLDGFKSAMILVFLQFVFQGTSATKTGFSYEYIGTGTEFKILKLRCSAGVPTSDSDIVTISIYNATTEKQIAWVSKGRQPTTGNISMPTTLFISGGLSGERFHPCKLEILMLEYESAVDQRFGCNVSRVHAGANIKFTSWYVVVNKTVSATTETTTTPAPFTDAPYRIGAVKEQKEMDTDSLPMTVLIVMLVLISILLFLAVFLLLHRYRSRCQKRDEELYRPPAYCMAPEHHLDWGDSSTLKSKGSARTINSRSHYSIAAHHLHMPLPPIPHSTVPRRGKTYRRPPSVGSSVKVPYVQPQDAIGQESSEDGEIAALSSGSPKVHYKSSRDRPSRQNSPLYACVPVSSTDE